MSLAKASLWTASSIAVKILSGLVIVKLLAVSYGPEGIGLASNYRQLITVLGVLAGAGIYNGITRYMAQYQDNPEDLRRLTGTGTSLVLIASGILAIIFLSEAQPISQWLFGRDDFQGVIRAIAFIQFAIGCANLLQAQLKGFRDAFGNALVVIFGALLGVIGYLISWSLGGYHGALIGLAIVPAIMLIPAYGLLRRRTQVALAWFRPAWHKPLVAQLLKYTLMALMTAVTLPIAWMVMRNLLAAHSDWQQVGLWQGVTSISDAYLQFITATFSVWLLPTLARLTEKQAIGKEIGRALRFVLPLVAAASLLVWLLRDWVILLLFTDKFSAMRDLFIWQLPGDVFKVGAYVFGYLVIAKGDLRFYLLTELSQFALLLGSAFWLIPLHGVEGAVQAYCLTYCCYFCLCAAAFMIWYRK